MQSNVTNVRTARCRPHQSKRDDDGKVRRLDDLRRQWLYGATCSGRGNTTGSQSCAGRPACRPDREVGSRAQLPAPVFDLGDAAAAAVALAGDNDKPATASAGYSFGSALCRYVCDIPGTASVRRSVGVCDMTPPTFYARSAIKRRSTDRSERS